MTDLRKLAAGRPCQVRYPGICNHDSSTTVLAHIRLPGITGTALKAPDALGAWCCSSCHDFADARVPRSGYTKEQQLTLFYEGVLRTQAQLIKEGKIRW
ncbi:MAG TPA: DUF1364 domain-containing protein [Aquabacterium sp.]|nr:DUF1364 domain-containing protein [Aquabacterium sp.]